MSLRTTRLQRDSGSFHSQSKDQRLSPILFSFLFTIFTASIPKYPLPSCNPYIVFFYMSPLLTSPPLSLSFIFLHPSSSFDLSPNFILSATASSSLCIFHSFISFFSPFSLPPSFTFYLTSLCLPSFNHPPHLTLVPSSYCFLLSVLSSSTSYLPFPGISSLTLLIPLLTYFHQTFITSLPLLFRL